MSYKYTQLAFIDSLWSLIPIFPFYTLYVGILAAEFLKQLLDCEKAYFITEWSLFGLVILTILFLSLILLKTKQDGYPLRPKSIIDFLIWWFVHLQTIYL